MKVAFVSRGHFRSFESTEPSWRRAFEGCQVTSFFHTWDEIDFEPSWYIKRKSKQPIRKLYQNEINLLKKWDPNVQIEKQTFTEEEKYDIHSSHIPQKSVSYRFNSLIQTLKRIPKEDFDLVVVGRYDVLLNNILFRTIKAEEGTVYVGARKCEANVYGSMAASDALFACHPNDIEKFYKLFEIHEYKEFTNCEEYLNKIYITEFKKINHLWEYNVDFSFVRI